LALDKLFEPARIRKLDLKNRIVMPAMGTALADSSGGVTEAVVTYYAERARGGVGLIIVEGSLVRADGKEHIQLALYDESLLPGLSRLTQAIKQHGAKCAIQLNHGGRMAPRRHIGTQPLAPSPVPHRGGEVPHELTVEEIRALVKAYVDAAGRMKRAGFDAVEVHGAHGHLVGQFLSALTNKRRDAYGGDPESRARFAREICLAIREEVGPEYPILFRLSVEEGIKGGITARESQGLVRLLVKNGVDAIDTSSGYKASSEEGYIAQQLPSARAPGSFPRGFMIDMAQAMKQVVSVPVIGVGRINDPRLADRFIREGKADLIAMGRALIADPELPNKAAQGRFDEIRTCIACNTCGLELWRAHIACAVNPRAGYEDDLNFARVSSRKTVVVVGGGPAGMEAARVAALRGHQVTLLEKNDYLGGNLVAASAPLFKSEISELRRYLTGQMARLAVKVEMGREANERAVLQEKPDAVVLATGGRPLLPRIPGATRESCCMAVNVLRGDTEVGGNVVVVGAGMVGCETAAFLAQKGKKVTLVTRRTSDFGPSEGLAPDMETLMRRWFFYDLWPKLDIEIVARAAYSEVTEKGLVVRDQEGAARLVEGDSIVFALGMVPNNELETGLRGKVPVLHMAGDCVRARRIIEAVHEGARVACGI